jgi:hypothetical protein
MVRYTSIIYNYSNNVFYIMLQSPAQAHRYCCSIGLELAEFPTSREMGNVTRSTGKFMHNKRLKYRYFDYHLIDQLCFLFIASNFPGLLNLQNIWVGEVYVNGQGEDVWCNSKNILHGLKWYPNDVGPSSIGRCYYVNSGNLVFEPNLSYCLEATNEFYCAKNV